MEQKIYNFLFKYQHVHAKTPLTQPTWKHN